MIIKLRCLSLRRRVSEAFLRAVQLDADGSGDIDVHELLAFVRLRTKDLKRWADAAYERIARSVALLARQSPVCSVSQADGPDASSHDATVAPSVEDGVWSGLLARVVPVQLTLRTFQPMHALLLRKLIGAGLALPDLLRSRPRNWRASPAEVWSLCRNELSVTLSECTDDLLAAFVLWVCDGEGVALSELVRLLHLAPTQVEACFWAGMRGYFGTPAAAAAAAVDDDERSTRAKRPEAVAAESHVPTPRIGSTGRDERPRLLPYKTSATNALDADAARQSCSPAREGFGGKRVVGVGRRAKRAQNSALEFSAVGLAIGGLAAVKGASIREQPRPPLLEAGTSLALPGPASIQASLSPTEHPAADAEATSASDGTPAPDQAAAERVPDAEVQAARDRLWAADLSREPAMPFPALQRVATPERPKPPFSPAHIRASTPGEAAVRLLTPAEGATRNVNVFLPRSAVVTPERTARTPERTDAPIDPMWAVSWAGTVVDFATVHSDVAAGLGDSRLSLGSACAVADVGWHWHVAPATSRVLKGTPWY
jgi:hypothetical protein